MEDGDNEQWDARRLELIEALTPTIRAKHPHVTWKKLAELVAAAADMQLLYERFGHEP